MDAELKDRLAKQCEAKRKYDDARQHLASVVERRELGAIPHSQAVEREALVNLLTAVTMTCVAGGENLGTETPDPGELARQNLERNYVQALGDVTESLSLVHALAERLQGRVDNCECVTSVCQRCRADEALLKKAGG